MNAQHKIILIIIISTPNWNIICKQYNHIDVANSLSHSLFRGNNLQAHRNRNLISFHFTRSLTEVRMREYIVSASSLLFRSQEMF